MGKSTTHRNWKFFGSSSLCRSLYFCAACRRRCPQASRTVSSGRWPFGSPAQPASNNRSSSAAPMRARTAAMASGEIAIQALGIVVYAQAALLSECLQFVALLAGDRADLRNVESPPAADSCVSQRRATGLRRNGTAGSADPACRCRRTASPARTSGAGTGSGRRIPRPSHSPASAARSLRRWFPAAGNDISRSICVNSGWRSARKSSSRKQRTIWKYLSKPLTIRSCLKICGDCGSA